MHTVFNPDGSIKVGPVGLVVFVRTLAQARRAMVPGDTVVTWASSGYPRATRVMNARRTLVKSDGRRV